MIAKFILTSGKHFYIEIPESIMSQVEDSSSKYTFIKAKEHRFEFIGLEEEKIPTFRQVDMIEIKVAKLAYRLLNIGQVKFAQDLLNEIPKEQIEEVIKNIGVSGDDPKVVKIRELKRSGSDYGKDKAMIQVLWWEAKRDALRSKIEEANVTVGPDKVLNKALSELGLRITKAIKDYQNFTEAKY